MKRILLPFLSLFLLLTVIISCSGNRHFRRDKELFDRSAVTVKYKSIADMNDAFFVIKENNFFEFYRQLFDSVKNTAYPGRYSMSGDTMLLDFYNKKGREILGSKAWVNKNKKEILFFDHYPTVRKTLVFN